MAWWGEWLCEQTDSDFGWERGCPSIEDWKVILNPSSSYPHVGVFLGKTLHPTITK